MTAMRLPLLVLATLSTPAWAAMPGAINGNVTRIAGGTYAATPYLIVYTSNTLQTQPACSTAGGNRGMIIYLDTDLGRELASIAKGAYFTGAQVTIYGTGTCTIHPGVEAATDVLSP